MLTLRCYTVKTDLSFQQKCVSNSMRWCYKYDFIGSTSAIVLGIVLVCFNLPND